MADKKTYSEVIDQEGKIGNYQEAPGGGTPIKKGKKAPSKEWVAQHRQMQPRDEDGQFTYNSANKKPLKYGPSRGTTVPPQLRGLEVTYAKKSGNMAIKLGDKFYACGKLSYSEFVENFKEWKEGKGFGDYGDLSGKASGRTGNPQWGERHVEKVEGPARSAKYQKYGRGGEKLTYKGDVLEFEGRFKEHEEEWATSKKLPKYARPEGGSLKRWEGDRAPMAAPKAAPSKPIATTRTTPSTGRPTIATSRGTTPSVGRPTVATRTGRERASIDEKGLAGFLAGFGK